LAGYKEEGGPVNKLITIIIIIIILSASLGACGGSDVSCKNSNYVGKQSRPLLASLVAYKYF
jgi:hypothetical protein